MANTLPTAAKFGYDAANQEAGTFGGLQGGVGDVVGSIRELITDGMEGATTVSAGVVTMPVNTGVTPNAMYPVVRLDGEGAAADAVEQITATMTEYRHFMVGIVDAARPITLVNQANDPEQSGDLILADGQDLTITARTQWVVLRRVGTVIEEVQRIGFVQPGSAANPATGDYNGGGNAVYNFRPFPRTITATAYTINEDDDAVNANTRDSNWLDLIFDGADAKTVDLPGGAGLAVGDGFTWNQVGAGVITFQASSGASLTHPDGYNTSTGDGAMGLAKVVKVDASVQWAITGALDVAGSDPASRTYVQQLVSSTVETDAASTSFKTAVTLTHTPPDNSDWLYLGRGFFEGDSSNTVNTGECKLVVAGTDRCKLLRPRYAIHQDAVSFIWAESYGVSPGSKALSLQLNSSNTTDRSRIAKPGLIGIQLQTDESFTVEAGPVFNNTTTFADIVSHSTGTVPAGDYIILAGGQWTTDSLDTAEFVVEVDGSEITGSKRNMSRNSGGTGYYAYACKVTLTNAGHTVKLRKRKTGSAQAESRNAAIVVLAAAQFKDVHYAEDQSESGESSSTGFSAHLSQGFALRAGWEHLALASAGLYLSSGASDASADLRLTRNGSIVNDETNAGTRQNAFYSPNGVIMPALVTAQSATDTYALEKKSSVDTSAHKIKGSSITILALAPL